MTMVFPKGHDYEDDSDIEIIEDKEPSIIEISDSDEDDENVSKVSTRKVFKSRSKPTKHADTMSITIRMNNDDVSIHEKLCSQRDAFIKSRIKIRQAAMEFFVQDVEDVEPSSNRDNDILQKSHLPCNAELKIISNAFTNLKERERVPVIKINTNLYIKGIESGKQHDANEDKILTIQEILEIMTQMARHDLSSAKVETPYVDHKTFF